MLSDLVGRRDYKDRAHRDGLSGRPASSPLFGYVVIRDNRVLHAMRSIVGRVSVSMSSTFATTAGESRTAAEVVDLPTPPLT